MPLGHGTVTAVIGFQQHQRPTTTKSMKGQSPRIPHRRLLLGSFFWKRFSRSSSTSTSSSLSSVNNSAIQQSGNNVIAQCRGGNAAFLDNGTTRNLSSENFTTSATFKIRKTSSTNCDKDEAERKKFEVDSKNYIRDGCVVLAEDEEEEADRQFFHSVMTKDELCSGFEPQTWRKDRCKKCFRLKEQHNANSATSAAAGSSSGTAKNFGNVASRVNRFLDKNLGANGSPTPRAPLASADTSESSQSYSSSSSEWTKRVYGTDEKTPKLTVTTSGDVLPASSTSSLTMSKNESQKNKATSAADETTTTQKRKTKLLLIKAEVSVDGRPSEPVDVETTPTAPEASSYSNRSISPISSLSKAGISRRPTSPQDTSVRSGASSAADSYETAPSTSPGIPGDPLSRTVSYESVASTLMEVGSMVTATSGRSNSLSERSNTPTESLDTDTHSFMRSIKAQLEIMENKCAKLEDENAKLRKRASPLTMISPTDSEIVKEIKEKLALAESLCQDYRDENTVLKCELRDLQELTSKHGNYSELKEWRNKLKAAESLCEELMDENETLKKDLRESQQEIDEMHDQYREEEIEEFRELQRELEQTAKNCRILQFKLRKSERRQDQTEADRQHLEVKLKEFLTNAGANLSMAANLEGPRLRELESELRIAKEVSVRLHNELESLDEKRCKLEDENFYLKEKVRELETRDKLMEQMRVRQELKRTGSGSSTKSNQLQNTNYQNGQGDANVMQLLRDLQDALERETDLRDQLKFAEDDIQAARKKLADLETENEGLMHQLGKFTNQGVGGRGKPPMKRSFSEGHAQIELELAEHEATVLKDRLSRMEKDSEKMVSQISLLEKELKKVGGRTDFDDDELQNAIPDTYYKQKIKMLEEEVEDLKKKLEDARRPESEQKLAASSILKNQRHQTTFSDVDIGQSTRNVDVHRQLSLVEHEVVVLRQRNSDLEMENDRLSAENKRISITGKKSIKTEKSTSVSSLNSTDTQNTRPQERIEQMEKDIHRFISRISELEREKDALNKEIERRKKFETIKRETAPSTSISKFNPNAATPEQLKTKINELIKENSQLNVNLKFEQSKLTELESQLSDYKQVINQSDDQKLISMSSKIDTLTQQLRESHNRMDVINYENATASNSTTLVQSAGEKRYEDLLKERVDILERALSDEKAKHKMAIANAKDGVSVSNDSNDNEILATELSNCHQMISTVEDQMDRIYKQIEQLEKQQSDKYTSVQSKSPGVQKQASTAFDKEKLLKDIAGMKMELNSLRTKLQDRWKQTSTTILDNKTLPNDIKQLQAKCQQQENAISTLKEQLEHANREKVAAQKHNETSTTRLLQTEERWNKELEKLKESYENQVKDLKYYLQEAERVKEEKTIMLQDRTTSLQEKLKRNQELESKTVKLEQDLKTRHKDLQDRIETEKKRAKEFETKYQKLETLYESDRLKLNTEKEKFKTDLLEIKKRYDETQNDFEKLKLTYDRKEQIWQKEKHELDSKLKQMQTEMNDVEKKTAKKAAETASAENRKLLNEMSSLKKRVEADADAWKFERANMQQTMDQKNKELEFRLDELERTKKELNDLKSRIVEQKQQLEETRRMRDEAKDEQNRFQQTWARERSELSHKLRQEEKVQQAEQQALQLKYESRIKVMEESAKRIQTQLSQTRRERDNARENLANSEKRIIELRSKYENDEKELRQRMSRMEKEMQETEDLKVQLEKERVELKTLNKNYETDKRLWNVEREQFLIKISELEKACGRSRSAITGRSSITGQKDEKDAALAEALDIANQLRKQLEDVKVSYDEEILHLQQAIESHRQDWNKERNDMQRKLKELQENTKILEIDRRNFLSAKDHNESEKMAIQAERDALIERLHDSEIHQLANKYKLDKVADLISDLQTKTRHGEVTVTDKRDITETIRKALEQLQTVREDMGKIKELGKAFDSIDIPDDAASIKSYRSSNGSRKLSMDIENVERDPAITDMSARERLAPVGSESESVRSKSPKYSRHKKNTDYLTPMFSSLRSNSGDGDRSSLANSFLDNSRSPSGDIGTDARLAELRLRSPSPSPRKITNYPEAPPNMVLRKKQAVVYDSNGSRHWTRRSLLRRSTSFDPTAPLDSGLESLAELDSPSNSASSSAVRPIQPRSSSTGGDGSGFLCIKTPSSLADSEGGESGSELGSARSHSPQKRRVTDIFASIRRGTVNQAAKAKRGFFATKKAASVETSDVGHRIGAMGVQVFPPAIAPENLPDSVRASESSLDDPPKVLNKSSSGSSLFARLRNRSSSRTRGFLKRQGDSTDSSFDTALSHPTATLGVPSQDRLSTKSTPTVSTTTVSTSAKSGKKDEKSEKTVPSGSTSATTAKSQNANGQENVLKIKDSLSNSSIRNSFGFRRLSASYNSVRAVGSKVYR